MEEKLRSVRSSLQEVQLHCSQQKQTISELQAKKSQQSIEMDGLRRRIEELQQVRTHRLPATHMTRYRKHQLIPAVLGVENLVCDYRSCQVRTRRRWLR